MYSDTPQIILTLTDRTAMLQQIENLCKEAVSKKMYAVCVPPLFVKKAKELVAGYPVRVSTVIGFPYGYNVIEAKLAEIVLAMVDGAEEMDMVINTTALVNGDWQYLARELNSIMPVVQKRQTALTIVIESDLLLPEDLIKCCDLYGVAGVQCFALSTGTEAKLPGLENVALVRTHLAESVGIKVSGTFATENEMRLFTAAGATSFGIYYPIK